MSKRFGLFARRGNRATTILPNRASSCIRRLPAATLRPRARPENPAGLPATGDIGGRRRLPAPRSVRAALRSILPRAVPRRGVPPSPPAGEAPRGLEPLEPRVLLSGSLHVTLDYRFDDNNAFFAEQARRDVFERAANDVLALFEDDLAAIDPTDDPAGTDNTWKARFTDPGDNAGSPKDPSDDPSVTVDDPFVGRDRILIFAGGKDIRSLGRGGPGGFKDLRGSEAFIDAVDTRGESGENESPETDFGPWGGSITFDTNLDNDRRWHFGETTQGLESDEFDFYSVAVHEMLHVLGFVDGSNAFGALVTTNDQGEKVFTGARARAEYDETGNVPLNGTDGSHWQEALVDQRFDGTDQEVVMDPNTAIGERKPLTRLDVAAMSDIGWETNNPPRITAPAGRTVDEDETLVLSSANGSAISVSDPDAGDADIRLRLSVSHGTLALAGDAGITIVAGAAGSEALTVEGGQEDINAALDGLEYRPATDFNGQDTLSLSADDLGHVGSGGARTDSAELALTVTAVNDAPRPEDDALVVDEDAVATDVTATLLDNDGDPDAGDTLAVTAVDGTETTGLVSLDGTTVTYDPADQFERLDNGETATDTFAYTVSDGAGATATATVTVTIEGADETFRVLELEGEASGFKARLNRDIDLSVLNAFDGEAGPADVTVTNGEGDRVPGSLSWNASTRVLSFVARDRPLAPGETFDVSIPSRSEGLIGASGARLDGDADGTAGDDLATRFTVPSVTGAILSVPDFARGPGQPVRVPADADGLPVRAAQAAGVTRVELTLRFDGDLLDVTAIEAARPAWSTSAQIGAEQATVTASGPELASGPTRLLSVSASVPPSAASGASAVIRVDSREVAGGPESGRGVPGLQAIALVGDADGDGRYSGLDASLVARAAVGLESSFAAHPRTDARVIGDIDRDGRFSGLDASRIARAAVGLDVPQIPADAEDGTSSGVEGTTPAATARETTAALTADRAAILASAASFSGTGLGPPEDRAPALPPLAAQDEGDEAGTRLALVRFSHAAARHGSG